MTESSRHSVSVAAAIFDESGENVLLIKRRDNGRWEPPGGVLELDETIEEGLRREVREETGAEIEIGPLAGVYKNMNLGIVALVFRCSLSTFPEDETPEASTVRWADLEEASTLMTPAFAQRIFDAIARKGPGAAVAAHDGHSMLLETQEVTE